MSSTRETILDTFADQLLEVGYLGASLEGIAAEVGIRKPSLYHHFPEGKEQLFVEVALAMIDDQAARLGAALVAPGGLRGQLAAIASIHADDPRGVRLDQRVFDALQHLSASARSRVSQRYVTALIRPVEALMERAVAGGELAARDPGLLATAFLELAQAVVSLSGPDGAPGEIERIAGEITTLFLDGAAA